MFNQTTLCSSYCITTPKTQPLTPSEIGRNKMRQVAGENEENSRCISTSKKVRAGTVPPIIHFRMRKKQRLQLQWTMDTIWLADLTQLSC